MRLKSRVTAVADLMVSQLGCRLIPEWRLANLPQSEHLAQLFRLLEIDCVLDVGANIGQYHEFLRVYMGYPGAVVSFEPVREMYEELERQQIGDGSWSIHQLALGDVDTTSTINVLTERTLSSLLSPNQDGLRQMGYEKYLRETRVERKEDVTVRRLDAIHEGIRRPCVPQVGYTRVRCRLFAVRLAASSEFWGFRSSFPFARYTPGHPRTSKPSRS